MGVLGNAQWEKFCQELHTLMWTGTAQKIAREQAYVAAGYDATQEYLGANARKLANRAEIKARLAELKSYSAQLSGIEAGWAQVQLKKMVESNIDDYLAPPDDSGTRRFNLKDVSRETLANLTELSQDEHSYVLEDTERLIAVKKIKVRLPNKIEALTLMAKIAGWLAAEKHDIAGTVTLESLVAASYGGSAPGPALPDPAKAAG